MKNYAEIFGNMMWKKVTIMWKMTPDYGEISILIKLFPWLFQTYKMLYNALKCLQPPPPQKDLVEGIWGGGTNSSFSSPPLVHLFAHFGLPESYKSNMAAIALDGNIPTAQPHQKNASYTGYKSLHINLMAHQASAYPGLSSMKQLVNFSLLSPLVDFSSLLYLVIPSCLLITFVNMTRLDWHVQFVMFNLKAKKKTNK